MPSLGGPEILVILLVALIVFGPTRLPEVGRQVGGALRELRKVQHSVRQEISDALNVDTPPPVIAPSSVGEGDRGEPDASYEPPDHGSFN